MIKIDIIITDGQELLTMSKGLNIAQAKEIIDFYVINKLDGELENEVTGLGEETSPDLPHSRLRQMRNQQTGESSSGSDVNGPDQYLNI